MLWLTVGLGWATWQAWSRREPYQSSLVEIALAGVVALMFTSTLAVASYKHPAWLISWEWLILLLAFCLVRQLGVRPRDHQALLAAVVATGMSLAGHALYQYTIELPQLRRQFNPDDLSSFQRALANQGMYLEADDPQLAHLAQRVQANNVFATFAHPNALAGYLALLLPVAVGWCLACWRRRTEFIRFYLATGAACLVGAGLWMTHSRGALLALVLIGLAFVVGRWYAVLWKRKIWVVAALLGALGSLLLFRPGTWISAGLGKSSQSMGYRLDYWIATWQMILDYPWLGVGPGNFGRLYPRYMLPTAFEKLSDPHNWLLEIWVTGGILALVAFVTALGAFFWLVAGGVRGEGRGARDEERQSLLAPRTSPLASLPLLPWEFYLGGMAGLVLGFLSRAAGSAPDEIVTEGIVACGRSLLWFLAFALLNGIPWSGPSQSLAIAAGMGALLFNCSVSGGISLPSLAQPLWVLAALALNALPIPRASDLGPNLRRWTRLWTWEPQSWLPWVLPLPILAALWLVYVVFFFYPVSTCAEYLSRARQHYGFYAQLRKEAEDQAAQATPPAQQDALHRVNVYVRSFILKPLEQARQADPQNSMPLLELATWHGEQAKLNPRTEEFLHQALGYALLVQKLDPQNKEGYLIAYRLHMQMAQQFKTQAERANGLAAKALEAVVERDPTEARWRYLLAEALFQVGDPIKGRLQAEKASQADELAREPGRRLTPAQREQVRQWLTPPS